MAGLIAEFLNETASDPFQWGVNDCALWPASLVERATGTDPASHLRGQYASWIECRDILIRAGGLKNLVSGCMSGLQAGEAQTGVGLALVGRRTVCGILLQGTLCVKSLRGYTATRDYKLLDGWTW